MGKVMTSTTQVWPCRTVLIACSNVLANSLKFETLKACAPPAAAAMSAKRELRVDVIQN
jgi:hypothetical protein